MCWMSLVMTRMEQHLLVRFHKCSIVLKCFITTANRIEELLSLEARYGPLTGYTPAIDIIIEYLEQVS